MYKRRCSRWESRREWEQESSEEGGGLEWKVELGGWEGGESGGGGEEHQMEAGREVEDSQCQAGVSIRRDSSPAERSLTGIDGPKRQEAPSGDHSREE